ncbi:hypothetical protein BT08F35_44240 [Escherichia coli]
MAEEYMMAPTIYHRIDGTKYRNVWVVGDLHGCYTRLMSELHRVDFDPAQDLLISVGDLIDRGTENVECLELLQMPWFRAVMGNHERLMIDALSPDGNVNNGNDSNLLIVFYVQIMPDDFVMQLHRF